MRADASRAAAPTSQSREAAPGESGGIPPLPASEAYRKRMKKTAM